MVSAIGGSDFSTNISSLFDIMRSKMSKMPRTDSINSEVAEETNISTKEQAEAVDKYITSFDYNSFMNPRGINSLEDYKSARDTQLKNEMFSSIRSTPLPPDDPAEREAYGAEVSKQYSLYDKVYSSIDFEQEYKDFMDSRGCKNEEDLQALNKTMYKTMDDLRGAAASGMMSVMLNASMRNPEMIPYLHKINSIVSSLSANSLANGTNSMFSTFESTGRAVQSLLGQAGDCGLNVEELKKISVGIDTMFKQIEEEEALNRQGQTVNFEKYQKAYQQQMMANYGK